MNNLFISKDTWLTGVSHSHSFCGRPTPPSVCSLPGWTLGESERSLGHHRQERRGARQLVGQLARSVDLKLLMVSLLLLLLSLMLTNIL